VTFLPWHDALSNLYNLYLPWFITYDTLSVEVKTMATKNPRLNVVLEPDLLASIGKLAHKQGVSLSLMARDLIKEALEFYEDIHWQKSAAKRDKSFSSKKALSHKDIWGV